MDKQIILEKCKQNKYIKFILTVLASIVICEIIFLVEKNKSKSSTSCAELPEFILNGRVVVNYKPKRNRSVAGTHVTFKCDDGYKLSSNISEYICQQNGNWSSRVLNPKCLLACDTPPQIPDATYDDVTSGLHFDGSILNFTCKYGKEAEEFNFILKSSISCLNGKWTKFPTCPEHTIKRYTFQITSMRGNFDQARKECTEMGGDLLSYSMRKFSEKYKEEIRSIIKDHGHTVWVGVDDRNKEGKWKYVTDDVEFAPTEGNTLFQWAPGEPNDKDKWQDCGCIQFGSDIFADFALDDSYCSYEYFGLCEIKNFYAGF